MEAHPLRIPGLAPGKGLLETVRAPYGGEALGEVEQADAAALERALELQSGLLRERAGLATHERIAVLAQKPRARRRPPVSGGTVVLATESTHE